MIFQKSLQEIVNEQSRILQKLESQLQMASLRVSKSATNMSINMINSVLNDQRMKQLMGKVTSFMGITGKTAAVAFETAFRASATATTKSLGALSDAISQMEKRVDRLSERKTRGWGGAAAAQRLVRQAEIDASQQLFMNSRLLVTLNNQLNAAGNDFAKRNLINGKIKEIDALNQEMIAAVSNAQKLGDQMKALEHEEVMQNLKEKAFGKVYDLREKVSKGASFVEGLVKSPEALVTAAVAAIVIIFKFAWQEMRKGLQEFRDAGQLPSQWVKSYEQMRRTIGQTLKRGLIIDSEEAAKSLIALQKELGNLEVPGQLRNESAFLAKMYELTDEESAKFVTRMYRFHGENADRVLQISQYVQAFSKANNLNAKEVIQDMNQHAEDFAKSGNMSAEAFARATQHARRLGYEMSSITSLADKLVSDFEGALKTQAELNAIFPNMDMSQVMYASQFGTNEDISNAMKQMLDNANLDFANMPRSFKLALSRDLGLSATELAQMIGGKPEDWVSPQEKDQVGFREAMMKSMFDLTGGIKEIIKLLGAIVMIVNPIYWIGRMSNAGDNYGTTVREDGTEVTKNFGVTITKRPGEPLRASDMVFGPKMHTGGIVGKHGQPVSLGWHVVPKFHEGLLPDEIPAILQKGEAVLTPKMLNNLTDMVNSMGTVQAVSETPQVRVGSNINSPTQEVIVLDTKNLEELLRQLLNVTKEGKTIQLNMDGREIGNAIVKANIRNG